MSNAYNACASIPLKLTLHRDTYLITSRLYSFPLDLRSREHRSFGEDLGSNAHDTSALKFFAKRRVACLLPRGSRGDRRNWHSLHGSVGGGSSAGGNPVRYADCAATSSYRNESIETFSILLSIISHSPAALDIPIKLRLIRVTRQLNISPFARKGHRESCPAILNPDREFCAYSLACRVHMRASECARFAQSCGALRAEEQLDALPPFLDLEESPFLGRIIPIGTQQCFRENRRMEFSAIYWRRLSVETFSTIRRNRSPSH